jgi:hypothetical protein
MENKLSPHLRWLTCTLRDSAIFALLFSPWDGFWRCECPTNT